jgi:hypothetical protein
MLRTMPSKSPRGRRSAGAGLLACGPMSDVVPLFGAPAGATPEALTPRRWAAEMPDEALAALMDYSLTECGSDLDASLLVPALRDRLTAPGAQQLNAGEVLTDFVVEQLRLEAQQLHEGGLAL